MVPKSTGRVPPTIKPGAASAVMAIEAKPVSQLKKQPNKPHL
jgi:hypothetical protein